MIHSTLEQWKALVHEHAQLIDAAAALDGELSANDVAHLRAVGPDELVPIALELTRARRKAALKFPDNPNLIADIEGVEQASSMTVANYKARRFTNANTVMDLCSGIGGDTMALANVSNVQAVDMNPIRAWMTSINSNANALVADVAQLDCQGAVVHIDPARRTGPRHQTRRLHGYDDVLPGPVVLNRFLQQTKGMAIKLGPGLNREDLPDPEAVEIEWIAQAHGLVQAVVWSGCLTSEPGLSRATRLDQHETFQATPEEMVIGPLSTFVHAIHPALERANLAGAYAATLGVSGIHPSLGLLTSTSASTGDEGRWLTTFQVLATFGGNMKRVRRWLRQNDGGIVEVKTRGKAVDPDELQKQLRGSGDTAYCVFVHRLGNSRQTLLTRRIDAIHTDFEDQL